MGKAPKEVVRQVIYLPNETKAISEVLNSLTTSNRTGFVDESVVAFITGSKKFKDWDTYIAQLDKIGLKDYINITQKAYDRMMK